MPKAINLYIKKLIRIKKENVFTCTIIIKDSTEQYPKKSFEWPMNI